MGQKASSLEEVLGSTNSNRTHTTENDDDGGNGSRGRSSAASKSYVASPSVAAVAAAAPKQIGIGEDYDNDDNDYSDNDILFGDVSQNVVFMSHHPGNQRYQTILEQYRTNYQNCKKGGFIQNALLRHILEKIQENGARFMTNDNDNNNNNAWVEMATNDIKLRVASALRMTKDTEKEAYKAKISKDDNDNQEENSYNDDSSSTRRSMASSCHALALAAPSSQLRRLRPSPLQEKEVVAAEDDGKNNNDYGEYDILCDTSKNQTNNVYTFHPGNHRFDTIVRKYYTEYQNAEEGEGGGPIRTTLIDQLLDEIQSNGARFMTNNNDSKSWVEMTTKDVREKVSRTFLHCDNDNNKGEEEEEAGNHDNVKHYEEHDILSGNIRQAGGFMFHPGNQRYRAIVEKHFTRYRSVKRGGVRRAMLQQVLDEIQSTGSRFMVNNKKSKYQWVEMKTADARRKIDSALRKFGQAPNAGKTGEGYDGEEQTMDDDSGEEDEQESHDKKKETVEDDSNEEDEEESHKEENGFGENDILCVKNSLLVISHPGNKRYRAIVDRYYPEYHNTKKGFARSIIMQQLLEEVQSNGARFMTNENERWVEMGPQDVRTKVSWAMSKIRRTKRGQALNDTQRCDEDETDEEYDETIEDESREEDEDKESNEKDNNYRDNDILSRSGKTTQKLMFRSHPGNQRYYAILEKYSTKYHHAKAFGLERKFVVQQALKEAQSTGARFMTKQNDNNIWIEMDTKNARKKVRKALSKLAFAGTTNNVVQDEQETDEDNDGDVEEEGGQYSNQDILCGNFSVCNTHPGNERYRRIIIEHHREFQHARDQERKNFITREVLKKIKSKGSRFIKPIWKGDKAVWVELDAHKAKIKVYKALCRFQGRSNTGDDDNNNKKKARLEYEFSPTAATHTIIHNSNTEVKGQRKSFGMRDERKERENPAATQQVTGKCQMPKREGTEKEGTCTVSTPSSMYCDEDILCVNYCKLGFKHPGCERYRSIIIEHHQEFQYSRAPVKKDSIAREVLEEVKSKGGRFMKPVGEGNKTIWVELDPDQELPKVYRALQKCSNRINASHNADDIEKERLGVLVSTKKRKGPMAATNVSRDTSSPSRKAKIAAASKVAFYAISDAMEEEEEEEQQNADDNDIDNNYDHGSHKKAKKVDVCRKRSECGGVKSVPPYASTRKISPHRVPIDMTKAAPPRLSTLSRPPTGRVRRFNLPSPLPQRQLFNVNSASHKRPSTQTATSVKRKAAPPKFALVQNRNSEAHTLKDVVGPSYREITTVNQDGPRQGGGTSYNAAIHHDRPNRQAGGQHDSIRICDNRKPAAIQNVADTCQATTPGETNKRGAAPSSIPMAVTPTQLDHGMQPIRRFLPFSPWGPKWGSS